MTNEEKIIDMCESRPVYSIKQVREAVEKALTAQHKEDMDFARWYATFTDYEEINAQDYNTIEEARQHWLKNVRGK